MEPQDKLVFQHYTIQVTNLQTSLTFYRDILAMQQIERPAFDFPGAWLNMGYQCQLHLILVDALPPFVSGSRALHFAFQTNRLPWWKHRLEKEGVPILRDQVRPDGIRQLFVHDPDGYFIEICDAECPVEGREVL